MMGACFHWSMTFVPPQHGLAILGVAMGMANSSGVGVHTNRFRPCPTRCATRRLCFYDAETVSLSHRRHRCATETMSLGHDVTLHGLDPAWIQAWIQAGFSLKWCKVVEFGMNQVQVPPCEPQLRQNVATASRNPLEYLWTPKTLKINT